MSVIYRVIITDEAIGNLEEIAGYVFQDSPRTAGAIAETILNAIDSLAEMPEQFRRAGGSRRRKSPIHAMVVYPFIVYYRVDESPATVHILHVIHGARKQPRRFKAE
ncbi:MAG: type II toxin-antitoxin system RelE/ParE family toxin [Phycisphaerales bacterium]|nr:type II toxin-antitoxin system RelE/ParE family toxin [Phycisphaerales bacterium]